MLGVERYKDPPHRYEFIDISHTIQVELILPYIFKVKDKKEIIRDKMPATQHSDGPEVPEHIRSHLDEIHKTAEAAEAALKADNTELATELKTKLKGLFENAPEEAKSRGFIGSGANIQIPQTGASQDVPESAKQIHDELKEVSATYNKAVQEGDHETATKLRAKLHDLRQQSLDVSKITSKLAGYFELWVEIHNLGDSYLYNDGGWDVNHGWFESKPVADWLAKGDVSYIHMGGAPSTGINCTAYYSYRDSPAYSGYFKWYYQFEANLWNTDEGGDVGGRWDGWHTVDGRIIRFYVQQR
ncbi:hypothetical protein GGI35DRAFT_445022 [Trichoderma velutinum]